MEDYKFNFQLCKDKEADELMKEYVINICDYLFKHYPKEQLEAIILTGGMTRGEGSVARHLKIYSDIDLLIVLKNNYYYTRAVKELPILAKRISVELREKELCSHVDYGPLLEEHLRGMTAKMFTVELKEHGKVIWGNENVLENIHDLKTKDIPRDDAINLLFNRMMGQLIFLDDIEKNNQNELEFAVYHNGKIFVDLAGSLLAFIGEYETTYQKRAEKFKKIIKREDYSWIRERIPNIAEEVDFWTEFKIDPDLSKIAHKYGYSTDNLDLNKLGLQIWMELADYVKTLWIWESNQYLKCKWTEDPIILAKNYFKKESIKSKVMEWINFSKHPHLDKNNFSYKRMIRLLKYGSPLLLAYISGAQIYFNTPNIYSNEITPNIERNLSFAEKFTPVFSGGSANIYGKWQILKNDTINTWRTIIKGGGE